MASLTVELTGVDNAIAALAAMKRRLDNIGALMSELCELAANVIREKYSDTTGARVNAASVTWRSEGGGVYTVSAQSDHLFYLEFGAGVTRNGAEPYPIARPPSIGGIGSQGAGQGNNPGWYYPDPDSPTGYSYTRGTRARAAFPAAYDAVVAALPDLVRKHLGITR